VSELVQLRVEDVSLAERVVVIRHGKGGKGREVPIRRELAQLLRLHIDTRRTGPLFPSRQKGTGTTPHVLTRQRVGQVVREVARAASITKRVYPHLLRHTMATRLLALGREITDVQRFLGHENIATTRLYAETTAAVSTSSRILQRISWWPQSSTGMATRLPFWRPGSWPSAENGSSHLLIA
jgi:integrase/recombinase XerD